MKGTYLMLHYRQGDVLIIATDRIPDTATPARGLILAHGEATGHKHQILDRRAVKRYVAGRLQYLAVKAGKAKVQHEEHTAVVLPRGSYVVLIQTEYTPGELRAVMD